MDFAELIKLSIPEIVEVLERNQRKAERELIELIISDEKAGLSIRESAKLRNCPKTKVCRIRKKMKEVAA